jgi:hypothetical protein
MRLVCEGGLSCDAPGMGLTWWWFEGLVCGGFEVEVGSWE